MASGVLLGLLAAICWGVADFSLRGAVHAAGTFRVLYFMQVFGILALVIGVEPWRPLRFDHTTPALALAAGGLGIVIMLGAALLYRSFAIGKLAVVSPIAASFGAIVTILALLNGEHPNGAQLAGLAFLLVGVALSSIASPQPAEPSQTTANGAPRRSALLGPGVPEAIGATILFGVAYFALRLVVKQVGSVETALICKIADFLALSAIVLIGSASRRWLPMPAFAQGISVPAARSLAPRSGVFWAWIIPGSILDISANVAYNIGVAGALTSIVATLSSLFTSVTIALAWIFLRERLSRTQWVGIAFILVGIALVNV
ncbi:MAG TPA: DMT family transporter [Ktedonobacterales bacterium]